jgi:hypothetical protein
LPEGSCPIDWPAGVCVRFIQPVNRDNSLTPRVTQAVGEEDAEYLSPNQSTLHFFCSAEVDRRMLQKHVDVLALTMISTNGDIHVILYWLVDQRARFDDRQHAASWSRRTWRRPNIESTNSLPIPSRF